MKARSLWLPVACTAGVVVLALGGLYGNWPLPFGLSWNFDRCETDDEVGAASRATYEDAALKFVRAVIGSAPEQAYADAASGLKAAITQDDFLTLVRTHIHPLGAIENWSVAHSYYVTGVTIGRGQLNPVFCTTVAHGSSSLPEGRVLVGRAAAGEQAHVIVEGATSDATWALVVMLVRDGESWLVYGFHATPIAVASQSALDLWRMGREQQSRHHDFNSLVLYATALQLSARGPSFQLGIQPEIKKDLDALPRPSELETAAPYHWRFAGVATPVLKIGPVGIRGKMYLLITQQLEPWSDNQDADRQNRTLIAEFSRAHPEYNDAFDGLAVDGVERGGSRTFRTIAGPVAASP